MFAASQAPGVSKDNSMLQPKPREGVKAAFWHKRQLFGPHHALAVDPTTHRGSRVPVISTYTTHTHTDHGNDCAGDERTCVKARSSHSRSGTVPPVSPRHTMQPRLTGTARTTARRARPDPRNSGVSPCQRIRYAPSRPPPRAGRAVPHTTPRYGTCSAGTATRH